MNNKYPAKVSNKIFHLYERIRNLRYDNRKLKKRFIDNEVKMHMIKKEIDRIKTEEKE